MASTGNARRRGGGIDRVAADDGDPATSISMGHARDDSHLVALCVDAHDPFRLARFWAGVLGWAMADDRIALLPSDDTGFRIRFLSTQEQKSGQSQMHFDLTSTSLDDQQQTVARSLGLGARHIDVGQRPEEGHVVLADPEGNEFCVIEAGNNFLAHCGFIGAEPWLGSRFVRTGVPDLAEVVVVGRAHPTALPRRDTCLRIAAQPGLCTSRS